MVEEVERRSDKRRLTLQRPSRYLFFSYYIHYGQAAINSIGEAILSGETPQRSEYVSSPSTQHSSSLSLILLQQPSNHCTKPRRGPGTDRLARLAGGHFLHKTDRWNQWCNDRSGTQAQGSSGRARRLRALARGCRSQRTAGGKRIRCSFRIAQSQPMNSLSPIQGRDWFVPILNAITYG